MPNLNGNSKPSRLSWRSLGANICGKAIRTVAAALLALAVSSPVFVGTPSQAAGDTRSLKLYFIHTGEKAVITYKRNGKFDPKGLEQLNRFLRDWRKNQPTKMDPRLFDLIWEVYRQSGSRDYINVVCGFRSPGTNEMLRGRSRNSGVAEKSQHMLGKAMDFFIPDVKLATLRAIGMKMQVGGVGFYPKSGSPFVHMDVGGVRAWPRMSRDELVRLFPNGNTIHIPADGKPLPGYQQAMADYKRRASGTQIEIASASESAPKHKTLFAALFGGGADEQEDESDDSTPVAVAKATPPKAEPAPAEPAPVEPQQTEVADLNAPVPQVRPAFSGQPAGSEVASALVAPPSGNAAQQALAAALPADQAPPQQFADLSAYSIPVPSLLGPRRAPGDAEVASVDPSVLTGANGLPVPTPIERPSVAENLLAAADADPEADADEADQDALSPAVADALEQQRNEGESEIASKGPVTVEQAINAAMTQKPAAKPPLELAALAPMTKSASFGDGFDEPAAESAVAQGLPTKGGRPTQKEAAAADASRTTVRTEPKLTEKMISQWALTNARLEMASKQVKAPRFVSQTMRAQPTAVYAEGFNIKTASVDPARFSGTAVNFMEVRKFNTN
ncbi:MULTISPECIES: DUF882 domain-containing protein [Rhizobium]|uniref:Murein endopeptidase K n=1 Tax=Rhizobium anhuiense TaxID=1184720 RepID=A0A3S0QQA6_9HYPH|nr:MULTISPECIES: DUF882 domain-containing protein [Rhizobium]KZS51898.1 ATP/GTP-binding protein [Rhizobium anhuiense bv. trifolii]PDS38643.1 DUF882 domain-containing protein [Rhizobium anhuiense]PDS44187.1 DUF882 domain-containing protein [Rhizobium anhuiense]PDS51833.1 DUF882 domain-containing protein [Rhizobium anhuiense]PDS64857.1 DUF882 domain-containing protein [Rhizobium anhuiense]